jgi:divinyl chlorophyllide a 8-vinyl-reductase
MNAPVRAASRRKCVLVLGATGTIGRAAVSALLAQGHEVVCLVRQNAGLRNDTLRSDLPDGATIRHGDVTDPHAVARDGICGDTFDALVSCLASRTGAPKDAWQIDCDAHKHALNAAKLAGIGHFVLVSAICVQKPKLEFQRAKLAFERELIASGLTYSIVRPTAFFKSLSGQVERVKAGKPFMVFGDGTLTSCRPVSDRDIGDYIAACLNEESRHNKVLSVGGPGPAITPKAQGEMLFELLGREPKFTHVPLAVLDSVIFTLGALGRLIPSLAAKAELARIGRYYATESMLVLNPQTSRYEEHATPSTGTDTLRDYYASLISGRAIAERREHAVF